MPATVRYTLIASPSSTSRHCRCQRSSGDALRDSDTHATTAYRPKPHNAIGRPSSVDQPLRWIASHPPSAPQNAEGDPLPAVQAR